MPVHTITLPTPFPVGPVNCFLLEGDPLTLIDCGPKHPATLTALQEALAQRGHRLDNVRQLVLTHHHVDHVGNARAVVECSGATVLTHPYNAPYLADYETQRRRNIPFYATLWAEGGVPAEIIELMRQAGEGIARWLDPVKVSRTIDEGDAILCGGERWHVYHTPGHAGGLICLHNSLTHELISNDHLLRDISSNPIVEPPPLGKAGEPRPRRLVEYIRHMQRMAALNPRLAYPGHGHLIDKVGELVRRRIAFHYRRADKIYDALAAHPQTLWQLTSALFGNRLKRGMDYFLGISEVLGHVDLLAENNRLQTTREDAQVKFAASNPL